ncbi:MAG TPA: gluconate 2-dehydrogenase subunit 3 family protein [Gemmatimonadaceae bacterium]|jgi:gluconate 2-dehydrogenase gamma chain|nr:gluconate 2-dehydrogenase subunit 3 family protein [Gemmatimonadaceae bacterium]
MANVSRRAFLQSAGAVAAALAVPACDRLAPKSGGRRASYSFFNADEAAFVEPAVARLIPADDLGPGALEAGVPTYMDRQLAGAWGAGAGLYRGGPWRAGQPGQGYQLPFTPAELFRKALRAIREDLAESAPDGFGALPVAEQDAYLRALDEGGRDLGGVPSEAFFGTLLGLTVEGFFSDPVYGGNQDMVGWKLVGFPGAYANYYEFVDQHGIAFRRPPMSLGQDASGSIHVHPAPRAGEEG